MTPRRKQRKATKSRAAARVPQLTLVVPAFNEAKRLPAFLLSARRYLADRYPRSHEILVVDDGSTDATVHVATSLLGKSGVIPLGRNMGKGAAVRTGMLAASGKLRLFADADGATPIWEEARLTEAIRNGADIAIGSRSVGHGHRLWEWGQLAREHDEAPAASVVWRVRQHRHLMGRLFATVVRRITGLDVRDTQCGFKMLRDEAADTIFLRSRVQGFAFDVEMLYLANVFGFHVAEIPVNWHEVSGSKVRVFRDAARMVKDVLEIRNLHSSLPVTASPARKAG